MNETLKIVLSLSLSGSLLILVLLLCKPLIRDRISKRWQYYIWLVVIARLLLPFTPETSPVGTLFQQVDRVIVQTDIAATPGQNIAPALQTGDAAAIKNDTAPQSGEIPTDIAPPPQTFFTILMQNLWLVWLVVALILLIRKITIYQGFVKYIKAGRAEVSDTAMLDRLALIGERAGVKRPVELYTNDLITSPLLIGFFRPCIVLPTADLTPADLEYTILHELTHYKRRDMFYKWLVQISICIHWFNPLAYLMGREVCRTCELSCDEAVIRTLDPQKRRAYGDTLLNAMGARGSYKDSLASVTLNESKELLKERLAAIMRFKKKSKAIISATLILTFAICFGATYVGAYASPVPASNKPPIADTIPQADGENGQSASLPAPSVVPSHDHVKVGFTGVSVTGQGPVGVELVRTQKSYATFELLNMDNEESCTTKAEIVDGVMQITVNNDAPNGINVNFGPDYQNVVRVLIPDAIYTKFEIQSKEMVVKMQDFNAPVHVSSNRAGFWLMDKIVSQGTYDIEVASGPIYIEADAILRDITANADSGPITVRFHKTPTNLYLDSTKCGPVVERPDDWPAIYKAGNETPKIILSNTGKAVITAPISNKVIREGGVYYIFCDGADEFDKPNSGVTEKSIHFVLVRKDGYTSIGPFDDSARLIDEVTEQCDYMLKARSITKEEAKLVMETAANVQLGNAEQYEQVPLADEEYAKWNIDKDNGAYYYENARLRMIVDLRKDNSLANLYYDKLGTADVRLTRGHNGDITKIEHLSQTEAEEILIDFEIAH